MVLTIIFSLAAAFLNALSSVIQRRVAGKPEPEELFRQHFIKRLLVNKIWIGAFGLQVLAFLGQAAALKNGSLIVVEPLLTVDLVFLLLMFHFKFNVPVGRKEWLAVVCMCLGLSGLLYSSNPQPGNQPFIAFDWLLAIGIMVGLIAIGIYAVRRLASGVARGGLSGFAAGLSFALVAALTKLTTIQLRHGALATIESWQVWALLAAGILSIIMTQNTYGAGPLSASQPAMEITEPVISIVLGIVLFGDSINSNPLALFGTVLSGTVAMIGMALMTTSKRLYVT